MFPRCDDKIFECPVNISLCRARHIKCDESWPVCFQCFRSQRTCPGYVGRRPSVLIRPSLNSTSIVPTRIELELVEYFRNRVIGFASDEFHREFWLHSILQVSRSVTAVWHATNALAASIRGRDYRAMSHPSLGQSLQEKEVREQSLHQHSMALRHIYKITESQNFSAWDKTIVLICNVLLAIYAIPGNAQAGLDIIGSSLALIKHWRFWECLHSPSVSLLATQMLYFFVKGERRKQESLFLTTEATSGGWHEAVEFLQKQPLMSAIGAYLELDMMWSDAMGLLEGVPFQPTSTEIDATTLCRTMLRKQFDVWETRYNRLVCSSMIIDPVRLAVLGARRILLKIVLRLDIAHLWDEMCWDEFTAEYNTALGLLDPILTKPAEPVGLGQGRSDNKFTQQIWRLLNFIARMCRVPETRRRAASLMHQSMRAMLRSRPPAMASSVPNANLPPLLVTRFIELELDAYIECCEQPKCIRGQFVCPNHRISQVRGNQDMNGPSFTLRTVGDVLNNRPGRDIQRGAQMKWY